MAEDKRDQSTDTDRDSSAGYSNDVTFPAGYSLHEPSPNFWVNVVLSIALFGALWPFARFLMNLFDPGGITSLWQLPTYEIFFLGLVSLLFGGTICLATLQVLSAGVAVGMNLILKTLDVDPEQLIVGAATGGISGLALSLPFCFVDEPSYLKCALLISTATGLTQFGGTWGAWRVLYGSTSAGKAAADISQSMRFGVRQMLLLSAWCALILTTLKYLRVLNERLLAMVGIWFVVQVVFVVLLLAWVRRNEGNRPASGEDGV